VTQARLARDAYSYLHLPVVAICAGCALYLLARWRSYCHRPCLRRRLLGAAVLLSVIPAALALPALPALGLVSTVCSLVVAYEAIRYRTHRVRIRHPELSA
jgi:hypothetical protein